jgi:hypothetical protein
MTNGVHCQTSTTIRVQSATLGSPSHSGWGNPRLPRAQLTTPQSGFRSARHIRPTTTGVSSIGRTSTPRMNHEPRRRRSKNRASAVPSTIWMTMPTPVITAELAAAVMNTGSASRFA